jgi:hypothetical protein
MPFPIIIAGLAGAAGAGLAAYFLAGDTIEGNQTNNTGLNFDGDAALLLAVAVTAAVVFAPQIKKALA